MQPVGAIPCGRPAPVGADPCVRPTLLKQQGPNPFLGVRSKIAAKNFSQQIKQIKQIDQALI